jgi:YVTN family beta-propeller protein
MNFQLCRLLAIAALVSCLLDGSQTLAQNAYITNSPGNIVGNSVSVIDTATNKVIATIPVRRGVFGVAVTPDGSKVYVTNGGRCCKEGSLSVIETATNTVTTTIPVGESPLAFGAFIGPAAHITSRPSFAGTPGYSNCEGQSIAALDRQFGGRNAAVVGRGSPISGHWKMPF